MGSVKRSSAAPENRNMINEGIRCEAVKTCFLCGKLGEPLYRRLRDRLFGAPGLWGHLYCPECRLVWLDPQPAEEDMGKIYDSYYTHSASEESAARLNPIAQFRKKVGSKILAAHFGYDSSNISCLQNLVGQILSWIPSFRERVGRQVIWIENNPGGRILDIGCGSGEFLAQMRDMGWAVSGVEPDASAVLAAKKKYGLNALQGSLESTSFPDHYFDVITMNHVIEHLARPVAILKECTRLLKPGGKIVLLTPNVRSWGHDIFKGCWRDLDPPRHFYVYSIATLSKCLKMAGLTTALARTTASQAQFIWLISQFLQQGARSDILRNWQTIVKPKIWKLKGTLFYIREDFRTRTAPVGEEILMIASYNNERSRKQT